MAAIHSSISAFAQEMGFFMLLSPEELAEEADLKDKAAKAYAELLIQAKDAGQDPDLLIFGIIHGMLWQKAADDGYEPSINDLQAKLDKIFLEILDIAFAKYISLGFEMEAA